MATLIEPMWILINRLLCMLQPLEELQDCNAKAKKSIDLNYSSLPPQLVILKALKSKHFVLAAVCTMALFANLLAVAFSGLFSQGLTEIRHASTFQPPFQFKFVPINGNVGPDQVSGEASTWNETSGAYQGGGDEDQFLIAESNMTKNTSLPPWTDNGLFYLPLFVEGENTTQTTTGTFEATANAFGAELACTQLKRGNNLDVKFGVQRIEPIAQTSLVMNITIPSGTGNVQCNAVRLITTRDCATGANAAEILTTLSPRENATQREQDACLSTVIFSWLREPRGGCPWNINMTLHDENALFVQCQPKLVAGTAKIRVDAAGRLQHPANEIQLDDSVQKELFSTDPVNLIRQSNLYLFRNPQGSAFHNDSFANDYINYFVARVSGSKRIVDPNQPVPTFDDIIKPLMKTYSKLFAIWLGSNKKNLLVPQTSQSPVTIQGFRIEAEQRLFVSTTMFIISEAILCTYALVAMWVYMRRPGQYLARLPTSIAAVVALFAASSAVLDMQETSHLDKKGRGRHLEQVDARYGYGSYIGGGDGRLHVGIEKTPFVRTRAKTTWLEKKLPIMRKGSLGNV
jgi:hypothetical protein